MGRRTDTKRASMTSDLERYCSMGSLRLTNTPPPSRLDRTTHSPVSLSSCPTKLTVKKERSETSKREGGRDTPAQGAAPAHLHTSRQPRMEEAAVEAPEQLLQVHHPVALLFLRHLLHSAPCALLHLAALADGPHQKCSGALFPWPRDDVFPGKTNSEISTIHFNS